MKALRFLFASILFFAAVNGSAIHAQSTKKEKRAAAQAALKQAIDNRRYNFQAQNAIPQGGRTRILTTPYVLALRGDSLDSDLPYFGRAYTANIGSTEGGIRFVTTDFTYTVTPGKKQGWEILLVPKDQSGASKMFLTIGIDGYATLSVQSINRQSILFNGVVTANKRQ